MQAAFQRYIEQVQAFVAGDSQEATLRGVLEACTTLTEARPVLEDDYRHVPEKGHGRNLIYHDEENGFVVAAMIWPPGHKGVAHDHASWCVMSVLEGAVDVTNYRRTDDGEGPDHMTLEETTGFQAGVGVVSAVDPPPAHYHVVSNASATETTVTLHTYGTDQNHCRVVDLATGAAKEVHSSYHNEAACQG